MSEVGQEEVARRYQQLSREAESGGYRLNPEVEFTKDLVQALLVNEKRYGYQACPCRLASGNRDEDLDIICPCDYRDPDLVEYGACYCSLYVSGDIAAGKKKAVSIPDRRPPGKERNAKSPHRQKTAASLAYPVWRCKVCGYLCARDHPPEVCPVCKAKKDRFEKFM